MRRRLEDRSFIPPFGLDQAFVAVGLPSQEPLRYWTYSGAYQVSPQFPPLAILHSRSDDVVPYQQSELLANNMELVGAPYELHFFDAGGHYLLAEKADADTEAIIGTTLNFLDKHLK
jgi:dipeptidyl aminopeptidase/acylaminoacyl peptidase